MRARRTVRWGLVWARRQDSSVVRCSFVIFSALALSHMLRRITPWSIIVKILLGHCTSWPAALCPRLTIGDVLRATGQEDPSPRLIRARTDSDTLVPIAIMPTVSHGRLGAVAVSFRTMEYPYHVCSQRVSIDATSDTRGRRRYRLLCPECQDVADSLYLLPGATELTCRRCARVSYHWSPARPSGSASPEWARAVDAAVSACREMRKRLGAVSTSTARNSATMDSKRLREPALAADEGRLTARQRAVAHLWGSCGWSVEQLGHLLGVSDRTIKRDLRVARAAGVAPRRSRGSTASLVRQARSLLHTCARLRETVSATAEDLRPGRGGTLWAAALQARLMAEERKLLALIAAIPGASRVRLAEENALPEYLDPDLLIAVTELAREEQ